MVGHIFVHEGKQFAPDGLVQPAVNAEEHNKALTEAELAYWKTAPPQMLAYYTLASDDAQPKVYREAFRTHGSVTTWTGALLGTITEARVYRHNFGGRFVSVRVRATNGAEYYGRASYDWGQCIQLRKVKA